MALHCATQDESSNSQVPTPNLGVKLNENDLSVDNVSQEAKKFANEEANPNPIDGAISQGLLRVL